MKKTLSLVLALVLMLGVLAGCGGGKKKDSNTIKIGLLAPLTGDVAEYGVAVANGVRLYTKEINANGGLNGKQVELIEYDEEGDAAKAVVGYNSLLDQGVVAIVGDVTSGPTIAVVSESQADNTPIITASATAAAVTYNKETGDIYKNAFRSCFIDPFQGKKMADFAYDVLGAKTAAVLVNSGDDYSTGVAQAFVDEATELGLQVVANESYANKAVDFQGQLTNIAAKNPDVLFVPDYYGVIALVAQQADAVGLKSTLLGADGWDTVLDVVSDTSLLEGAYYCSGYSTKDTRAAVQSFLSAYKAEYSKEPNMFSAQAYDAAKILYAAIAKADAADNLTNEAVIANLKATDMDCVTGHVTYDEYNNPEKTAVIINLTGGEAKFWGNY